MRIKKITLAVTMAMCFLPFAPTVLAAEGEETPPIYKDYQIDEMTCREMLMMGGTSRDFTMIYMHGFMSGKKSELLFQVEPLSNATDAVLDGCINNPEAKLLSVFEKVRK